MRNKYAELFKKITPQQWKKICDECLTSKNISAYFGVDIPSYIIKNYEKKFGYSCPLNAHSKDERGNKYGHLTVKSFAGRNKRGEILWNCQCDCGTFEIRSGVILRDQGHNAMCDKCRRENMSKIRLNDLTGQTINKLYIEKRVGSRKISGLAMYQCLCLNCGNRIVVDSGALTCNNQISCGCINSSGEYKITKILQELNIFFKKQFKINECRNKLPLPFDFAIFNSQEELCCLIEFQGRQHYYKIEGCWEDTEENFQERLKRDQIKRNYCKENNIPLIEIPYTELDKLSNEYIQNLLKPYL